MNKPGHVQFASIPHSRHSQHLWAKFDSFINDSIGTENIDWWVYIGHQESRVIYTVKLELVGGAILAVKRFK